MIDFINKKMKLMFVALLLYAPLSFAMPVLNSVVAGEVTIKQTPTETIIIQHSQKAIINWDSLDIQANEKVEFIQPNSEAATLNRTHNPVRILGKLKANGKIIIVAN